MDQVWIDALDNLTEKTEKMTADEIRAAVNAAANDAIKTAYSSEFTEAIKESEE